MAKGFVLAVVLLMTVLAGVQPAGGTAAAGAEDNCHPWCVPCNLNLVSCEIQYLQAGIGDVLVICELYELIGYCLGGAIFHDVIAGITGKISIEDNFNTNVGGAYRINGGETVDFCNEATVFIPTGAEIDIFVDGPVHGTLLGACGLLETSIGVEGVVRLSAA